MDSSDGVPEELHNAINSFAGAKRGCLGFHLQEILTLAGLPWIANARMLDPPPLAKLDPAGRLTICATCKWKPKLARTDSL